LIVVTPTPVDQDIPSVVALTAPAYPREAKDRHIMGKVVIRISVGRDGLVAKDTIVTGHPVFAGVSAEAVKQWRFKSSNQERTFEITFSFEFLDKCEGTDKHPITSETYVSAELPYRVFIKTGLQCIETSNGAAKR
jgi:TonB family protein